MSTQLRDDDASSDLQEAAEEEDLLKLEEEIQQISEKIVEYRTTLPIQLTSTLSSLLASLLQTRLIDGEPDPETRMLLPSPHAEAGVSQGLMRRRSVELDNTEAEKIHLMNLKISRNTMMLPIVLKRMEEYMARIDNLESMDGIIHHVFRRKWTS